MRPERLNALTDGVVAIVLTIMVLELRFPEEPTLQGVLTILPLLAAYLLAFIYVAIYWNNHHHMMQSASRVTGRVLWANNILLFWITLFPLMIRWIGEAGVTAWPVACFGLVLAGALLVWLMQSRATTLFSAIGDVLNGGDISTIVDVTTRYRLDLYWAGYQAFLQSPIVGHGWARLMTAAFPFLPADRSPYLYLPQLHNDVVNFAVAAGVVGVAVYLLLLAAPLVGVLRSPRDGQFNLRLYGVVVLVTAYIFDGLTDLMLGFEFHTAIYACLAAILIGYCRDERPA